MPSDKMEEYLEAIHKLEQEGKPVRPHKLAENLKVSPPAVAEMLRSLTQNGFVERTDDSGILLTPAGEKAAVGVVRQHRLWERFLTDKLGLPWHKVHDEACRLEHIASPEMQEGLEKLLANPETCPHGQPIPTRDGVYPQLPDTRPLAQLGPGQRALIVKISEEDTEMLQYLATLGLIPKIQIKVEEVAPFNGPLLVKVGRSKYAIGRDVASRIQVAEVPD